MEDPGKDIVARVLGELLRAPEPVRDIEVDRALTRLQAARSDTPYLLLHRMLVLETALLQLRQREAALAVAAPATPAAPAASAAIAVRTGMAAAAPPTRSFLRDAAVVTLGVVAGQAVWGSMSTEVDGALGELGELGELGDLGGLLD